jgi:hypothetical protein
MVLMTHRMAQADEARRKREGLVTTLLSQVSPSLYLFVRGGDEENGRVQYARWIMNHKTPSKFSDDMLLFC